LLPLGVALHDAAAGAKVTVATEGVWMLYAEGSITAGDLVEAGGAGDVRTVQTYDNSTSLDPRTIVGRALADIANNTTGPVRLGI
jgi:predicted RecA/RadA family phage recombinase